MIASEQVVDFEVVSVAGREKEELDRFLADEAYAPFDLEALEAELSAKHGRKIRDVDVMSAALEGYAFLKIAGKGEGLDSLRRALSVRFNRSAKRKEEGMAPVTQ